MAILLYSELMVSLSSGIPSYCGKFEARNYLVISECADDFTCNVLSDLEAKFIDEKIDDSHAQSGKIIECSDNEGYRGAEYNKKGKNPNNKSLFFELDF